jgi:hypothetical protein
LRKGLLADGDFLGSWNRYQRQLGPAGGRIDRATRKSDQGKNRPQQKRDGSLLTHHGGHSFQRVGIIAAKLYSCSILEWFVDDDKRSLKVKQTCAVTKVKLFLIAIRWILMYGAKVLQ